MCFIDDFYFFFRKFFRKLGHLSKFRIEKLSSQPLFRDIFKEQKSFMLSKLKMTYFPFFFETQKTVYFAPFLVTIFYTRKKCLSHIF